jgi:SAM-dependent methyltransferase
MTAVADLKRVHRATWAAGDYAAVAEVIDAIPPRDVLDRVGVEPGMDVLDVATGTGNVALRAAEAGAEVVGLDLTPEHFVAARREALERGVEIEWVQGDVQALPFADREFDVVTSALGAIFAPDHRAAAGELLRVCRPGGTIGMVNFTPEGLAGEFFGLIASHAPPTGDPPPVLWGSEAHVRELLAERAAVDTSRRTYAETVPGGPRDYVAFFKRTFGPMVALYSALDAAGAAALDRDFVAWAERANDGPPAGPVRYVYEYLLVVARLHGA